MQEFLAPNAKPLALRLRAKTAAVGEKQSGADSRLRPRDGSKNCADVVKTNGKEPRELFSLGARMQRPSNDRDRDFILKSPMRSEFNIEIKASLYSSWDGGLNLRQRIRHPG